MKVLNKFLAIMLLFTFSAVFADETRAQVGDKKPSQEEISEMLKLDENETVVTEKKQISNLYDNPYPPLIYNHCTHNVVGVSVLGDYLVIEDGSQWQIRRGYSKEAFRWKEDNPILIVKNDSFASYFNGYRYKMINIKRNTYIEVALDLAPILENQNTLLIAAINPTTCEIILSDNSLWRCDPSQRSILANWESTHAIIIGTNQGGWFKNAYDNILINVFFQNEIRATRVE